MKKTNYIYNERSQLETEKFDLLESLQQVDDSLLQLQNECDHKVVLEFSSHIPHKATNTIECLCTSCGKKENLWHNHDIQKSSFKNSRIIDLTNLKKKRY